MIEKIKRIFKKNPIYPCTDCVVFACCSMLCDKIIKDERKLHHFFNEHRCCPDCGTKEFYEGPRGGMSTNIKCAGCSHKFNRSPVHVERI